MWKKSEEILKNSQANLRNSTEISEKLREWTDFKKYTIKKNVENTEYPLLQTSRRTRVDFQDT